MQIGESHDSIDISNQAHIYICQKQLFPPPGLYDVRRVGEIVRDGIIPKFHNIDSIQPLSAYVLRQVSEALGPFTLLSRFSPPISE